MSLLFCVRRVSLSQSFNTLKRHRHLTTESCTGRVLFLAKRMEEQQFYSAKIQKGDTHTLLGPAIKLPPIPFKRLSFMDHVTQVCNGLLCHREDSQFYIFSPDTGEVSTLPDLPTPDFPCKPYRYGDGLQHYIGFDPLSNEPKVLLFQSVSVPPCGHIKNLFWTSTRGSGSWNRIPSSPPQESFFDSFYTHFKDAVFANGTIHWIYDNEEDFYDAYSYPRKYILAFDMVEEKFRKIPHPDDSFSGTLTKFRGRLALIEHDSETFEMSRERFDKLECWILEDNHKWVKETIHFPFGWRKHIEVLAFDNNTGEMLLNSKYCQMWEKKFFFYYNTKTGIFRTAEVTGFPQWCHPCEPPSLYPVDFTFDV